METGAKKPAAVAAPAPAAAARQPPQQQQQQQGEELFETKHAELLSEARDVAQEFGADVHAVVFRPGDGGAVRHEFVGAGQEARLKEVVGRAVAKDVSAMGMEEVVAHEKHLQRLRAVVANELRAKAAANKADKAAAAGATSSPPRQEVSGAAAAGSSKE
ncbi:hypothetical protein HU200_050727 [Digitaria exilis]|uniref:Uncharacterized protein n=1 Tax=Digitaria exilis TaxID=1010633 RepID=A0A835EA57_9POAL|nr:hypothetical protein HU200_052198 [Digitaria exilis]KAF8670426.1 hypothetical protein HU200_050727 [Digitaria exilis]